MRAREVVGLVPVLGVDAILDADLSGGLTDDLSLVRLLTRFTGLLC